MNRLLAGLFVLTLFAGIVSAADQLNLNATANYQPSNATSNFTFQIGNLSKQYAFTVHVNYTGAAENLMWYAIDFVMPYGVSPVTVGNCNGGAGWRVVVPYQYYGCQVNHTTKDYAANFTNVTILVRANMSAYTSKNLTDPKEPLYFWANVTTELDGIGTGNLTFNTTADGHYAISTPVNPRPFVNLLSNAPAYNSSGIFILNWNSTDLYYAVDIPLMTYNETANMPQPRNNTPVDVMYQNGMMAERPSFMRLWGYNLTFEVYNATNTTEGYTYAYLIRTPVNGTLHPAQTLMPLLVYNQTQTDFMNNQSFNMTMGTPAQSGFSVWLNGVQRNDTWAAENGLSLMFIMSSQDSSGFLLVNCSNTTIINNTEISVLLTLTNMTQGGGGSSSPIKVLWQSIDGLQFNAPPKFGENVSFSYTGNVTNSLNNYTLQNLTLRYFLPINVTMYGTSAVTHVISNGTRMYWWDGDNSNWTYRNVISRVNCTNVTDAMPGSPSYGSIIMLCFAVYERQLYHADFSFWQPNATASNATIMLNGTLSFPVLDESSNTPNTVGSTNSYNATFSASTSSGLNLTDKVPGIGASGTTYQIYIDGSLATSGVNYTVGSLILTSVGSGTHSVSVSYTRADTAGGGSGNAGEPCGSCALDGVCRSCCSYDPDCGTPSPTPAPTPGAGVPTPTVLEITPTPSVEGEAAPAEEPPVSVEETGAETPSAGLSSANAYIEDARAGMISAQAKGYDVSDVQHLIGLAESARDAGDYVLAKQYAQQAQDLVSAKMSAQLKKAGASDWMPIAAVLAVLVIGGAWYFFGRKK